MLVVTHPGKIEDVLGFAQPLRTFGIVAKAQDLICVRDVNVVIVKGNSEWQIQVVGKYLARLSYTLLGTVVQHDYLART